MAGPSGDFAGWVKAYLEGVKQSDLFGSLTAWAHSKEVRYADPKPVFRTTRDAGPMTYIAQQIVKRMTKMGYPSRIAETLRTPERQAELKRGGRSKANGWQSPHQFGEAADIVHLTMHWQAPPEYWEALATCVRVVAAELRVELVHGHYWNFVDSAHVELKDWRTVRDDQLLTKGHNYAPTPEEYAQRWRAVLPSITA